jgi:hypothetical protein
MIVKKPKGRCQECSQVIADSVTYFSFGAVIDLLRMDEVKLSTKELGGFCYFGVHGNKSDMSDCADFCIGEEIEGGQLDISFCSTTCLRTWLNGIVDYLEAKLEHNKQHND